MLNAEQIFLKCFYDNKIKYFHDSLSNAVIVAPGQEIFSANCAQFLLKFTKWEHFSLGTVIIHFWDKFYQDINFKSHLNSVLVRKKGKLLSDLNMFHLVLFHFTCLCSLLQWNWKMSIIKFIVIIVVFCDWWKIMSDLNMSHRKLSYFVSFPLFGLTLAIKLRNFDFKSYWNTSIFFDKKDMTSDLNMPYRKMSHFN